jgi:hypothetical protein
VFFCGVSFFPCVYHNKKRAAKTMPRGISNWSICQGNRPAALPSYYTLSHWNEQVCYLATAAASSNFTDNTFDTPSPPIVIP